MVIVSWVGVEFFRTWQAFEFINYGEWRDGDYWTIYAGSKWVFEPSYSSCWRVD